MSSAPRTVRTSPGQARLRAVAQAFEIPGRFASSIPFGSGHINDTFLVVFESAGRALRYIQQRINRDVFREPERVMENVARVTEHQHSALEREGADDPERRALRVVHTREGAGFLVDAEGDYWRTYPFIEGASSQDVVRSASDARAAAEAFGRFQAQLADLPGPRLHETISRFLDGSSRLEALLAQARADPCRRLADCRGELERILARQEVAERPGALRASGAIPERITHNDTKLNNVLLDDRTGEAVCVIDLDTVMPGLALFDFGDLVRTAGSPAPEDECDLRRVKLEPELFAALVEGYLRGAGAFLGPAERAELVFGGRFFALLLAMRFLTDHLGGDSYFKIQRAGHNLDRARAQLALVESIERQQDRMLAIVAEAEARRV